MPQGDLFISKVLTWGPRDYNQDLFICAAMPFTGDPTLVALCPGHVVSTGPFSFVLRPAGQLPSWALSADSSSLWFWVWAGFSPRIPQGNCQAAHPLPPGLGPVISLLICASLAFGVVCPFPFLL